MFCYKKGVCFPQKCQYHIRKRDCEKDSILKEAKKVDN